MGAHPIELDFSDVAALEADFEQNLRRGRAFVAGAGGIAERTLCTLVIVHPATHATIELTAEAVYIKADDPGKGVGLKLEPFDAATIDALRAFIASAAPEQDAEEPDERDPVARNVHERVRALSLTEQQRMARNGTLPERVALERTFGPAVWEALLSNTRISPPEVARIAKKGTLPKPLLELIGSNGAWVGSPEVQRALLANPRTSSTVLTKVLKALSRADLLRVSQQTAYPIAARLAAKKMVKDS